MKMMATQNFKANGVKCKPGYILSEEDMHAIGAALMGKLLNDGMIAPVDCEEAAPAEPENEGMLPDAKDDLGGEEMAGSYEEAAPAVEEKPKKKKK